MHATSSNLATTAKLPRRHRVVAAGYTRENWLLLKTAEKMAQEDKFCAYAVRVTRRYITEYHCWQRLLDKGNCDDEKLLDCRGLVTEMMDLLIDQLEDYLCMPDQEVEIVFEGEAGFNERAFTQACNLLRDPPAPGE